MKFQVVGVHGFHGFILTANTNTVYSLSRAYAQLASQQLVLIGQLIDNTAATTQLFSRQRSLSTLNESFALGGLSADLENILTGSLTGNLIAGHYYTFSWDSYVQAAPASDFGGSATGNIMLNIGGVPLPAATWLFGSGLIGLIWVARRKKAT